MLSQRIFDGDEKKPVVSVVGLPLPNPVGGPSPQTIPAASNVGFYLQL
jgi:hypothetical protein